MNDFTKKKIQDNIYVSALLLCNLAVIELYTKNLRDQTITIRVQ